MNYDYNMSGYVKTMLTCNYKNIFRGSCRTRRESEQLVFPRECLDVVRIDNWNTTFHTSQGVIAAFLEAHIPQDIILQIKTLKKTSFHINLV